MQHKFSFLFMECFNTSKNFFQIATFPSNNKILNIVLQFLNNNKSRGETNLSATFMRTALNINRVGAGSAFHRLLLIFIMEQSVKQDYSGSDRHRFHFS